MPIFTPGTDRGGDGEQLSRKEEIVRWGIVGTDCLSAGRMVSGQRQAPQGYTGKHSEGALL